MVQQKTKISQDTLYKYLTDHDVKILRIAELMGVQPQFLYICFRHLKDHHGRPRNFSVENIGKLNESLTIVARELRERVMNFGTDKTYTNKHGRTYDPGMIEPIKKLGELMNLTALVERLLGWKRGKRVSVITDTMSKAYGNISREDVMIINTEVLSVAGALENIEVIPDDNAFTGYGKSSSSSSSI